MKRRRAIRLGGALLLAPTAGCVIPDLGSPSEITVSQITLRNRLDRDIKASVLLVNGDDIILWRTVTISTAPNQFVTFDNLPAKAGQYTLYAQIPGTETGEPVQVDLVNDADGQSCIEVTLEITLNRQNGSGDPTVLYGSIGECERQN